MTTLDSSKERRVGKGAAEDERLGVVVLERKIHD